MFSRIAYAFRETWESFRRNITLTVAAVLTSAVSLLLVGSTFLIQRAFENLLVQWRGDVEMIVFVRSDASAEQVALIDSVLRASPTIIDVEKLRYLNKTESYEEAKRIFAGDQVTLGLLTPETIPTQFKVVPLSDDPTLVRSLSDQYRTLPGVEAVALAEDEFEVISTLSNFIRVVTLITSLVLLLVAVGLIWNTIRTAMFARRREIEVMKLVGATNWFIRVPFMLEGLLQGLIGGFVSCGGLWLLNSAWTNG
ncbi:MAG: cell division protein FtsX, partial [Acidimicrobiaceae bacterium]